MLFLRYCFSLLFLLVNPLSSFSPSIRPHKLTATPASRGDVGSDDVKSRVIAIGDVHGDMAALTQALRLGGLIGSGSDITTWQGGRTKCVLVGDMLDRGDEEVEVLNLLEGLRKEARAVRGSVTCLLGNHEVMNACGDFRYTSPEGNQGFASIETEVLQSLGGQWGSFIDIPDAPDYPGLRTRAAAFAPGGLMARRLSRFPVAAIIHGTLFVHAAVTSQALSAATLANDPLPLRTINRAAGAWLRNEGKESSSSSRTTTSNIPRTLVGPESLVWSRQFGKPVGTQLPPSDASELAQVLTTLGADRMVIGHTPQAPGGPGINAVVAGTRSSTQGGGSGSSGQCWRIDTGMASSMGGKVEVLEITSFRSGKEASVRILTGDCVLEAEERKAWSASDSVLL